MRRFKFSLDKLLSHRKMQVDLAQRDYMAARAKEIENEKKLLVMQTDLKLAVDQRALIQKNGGAVSGTIQSVHEFCTGQKVRIGRQTRVLNGMRDTTEQKRLVVVEAMKQIKTLEKLREKKKSTYDLEQARLEMKEIDEMNVMRHGRRETL